MNEIYDNRFCDPNGQLTDEELGSALEIGHNQLSRWLFSSQSVSYHGCKTLILGTRYRRRILLYLRVTRDWREEDGAGSLPPILIDAAHEFRAEPHFIRINMIDSESGCFFDYLGLDALEAALNSNSVDWNKALLKGFRTEHFLRLKGFKINSLKLEAVEEHYKNPESVILYPSLTIDGIECTKLAIDIVELAKSVHQNGQYYIFTCGCGDSGCAGINNGVTVVTDGGYTVWKAFSIQPRRIFVFESDAYRKEIEEFFPKFILHYKCLVQKFPDEYWIYFRELSWIEKAFYEIGENTARPPASS